MQLRCWGFAVSVAFVLALLLGGSALTADNTRDRTISFYNIHNNETLTIQYMKGGKRIPEALEKINWILRDWRRNEATQMDPELIDLLWEIHTELGSAEPIHIISGYRSRDTNEMLRRTVGGQASQSRHILGKAADVQFPDVPLRRLRYSALIHERGGVGYYPTSAIPFVHVDTDRVRAWPRLPRTELALLFPSGRTQHVPDDGHPLTRDDVRAARANNVELAAQIAAFHDLRAHPKTGLQMASLTPSLPRLLSAPRPAERPPALVPLPNEFDRARLAALAEAEPPRLLAGPHLASRRIGDGLLANGGMQLAAADAAATVPSPGRMGWGTSLGRGATFVPAPAFDEEHPEELSYRPFPIAPFMTATASADDPALARMVHPDLARALELIDQAGSAPPMRLRPGLQAAEFMWAQQFKGEAINLSALYDQDRSAGPGPFSRRRVVTSAQ